jgi:hypothetical protein
MIRKTHFFFFLLKKSLNGHSSHIKQPTYHDESKGAPTPRQQLATCCLQHFLVMTGNMLPIVALV